MSRRRTYAMMMSAVFAFAGCSQQPEEKRDCLTDLADHLAVARPESRGGTLDGQSFNGILVDRTGLNGIPPGMATLTMVALNRAKLVKKDPAEADSLDGVRKSGGRDDDALNRDTSVEYVKSPPCTQGYCIDRVRLDGTLFVGNLPDGRQVSGMEFEGAEFVAQLSNGETVRLGIERVLKGTEKDPAIYHYMVTIGDQNDPKLLCGKDGRGNPISAIPLQGRWDYRTGVPGAGGRIDDPDTFIFACRGFALAECIEMGYKPYQDGYNGVSGADMHEACVRAMRADFCGDGNSWTDGQSYVNFHDAAGIQKDPHNWLIEAGWSPDGAVCMKPGNHRYARPVCHAQLVHERCGNEEAFDRGALVITEVPYERTAGKNTVPPRVEDTPDTAGPQAADPRYSRHMAELTQANATGGR